MKIEWKTCFRVGITVLIVYFAIKNASSFQGLLFSALGAAIPLFIGCILAYIINIVMSFYERHFFPVSKKSFIVKIRRPICMVLAFITLILIVVLVFSLILPELIQCITQLINDVPRALEDLMIFLENKGIAPKEMADEFLSINWKEKTEDIITIISSYFGNVMTFLFSIVTSVFSGVVSALLSIIFACYLLIAKDKLRVQSNKLIDCYLSTKSGKRIRYCFLVFNESFHKYIVGQCTEAVILGILCTIGMSVLQLPYATMIGALVAFTALVPIVGAYIGAAVGAFMIAMVDPIQAIIFLVFLVILQQFEGNIIYPKVVGSSVGLPAIWVLLAVTVGGGVLGIPGMLIGVPVAAGIYRIIKHDVKKKLSCSNKE